MTRPQQPEIARSEKSAVDQDAWVNSVTSAETGGDTGPVPEANQPRHHPDTEQDKPEGRP